MPSKGSEESLFPCFLQFLETTYFFDNRNQVSCGLQMGFPFIVHLAFNGTAVQRAGGCPAGTCSVKFLGRNCLHLMQTPGAVVGQLLTWCVQQSGQ